MSRPADSLRAFSRAKLADLASRGLARAPVPTRHGETMVAMRDGKTLIDFCANDYLGLAQDLRVTQAAAGAALRFGAGAMASRLVSGDHPLIAELEAELARWKGAEAACVFGSGYLANLGIVPVLAGPGDGVFIDELAHACLFAGAQLTRAETHVFRHNDMEHLAALLSAHGRSARHRLILTDGVFSMDGDLAALPGLAALAAAHGAWAMVDDAHATGWLGPDGAGSAAHFGAEVPLKMGTLSKALGSYGGFLCANAATVALVKSRARSLVYSTGLPPAAAGAALAAIRIARAEPERRARPLALARRFCAALNLPEPESPIVRIVLGRNEDALAASDALSAAGFLVSAIRPPTVPDGTARLRITFSAAHEDEAVAGLIRAVAAHVLPRNAA